MRQKDGCTWLLAYYPGQPGFYGEFQQCSSDVYLLLRRKGHPDEVQQLNPHRGKGGRYDLEATVPGWPRRSYYMRILGWYFLRTKHLTWAQFSEKVKHGRGTVYKLRVNHKLGRPENCMLQELELVDFDKDLEHYAEHAKELYGRVWKRPAAKRSANRS